MRHSRHVVTSRQSAAACSRTIVAALLSLLVFSPLQAREASQEDLIKLKREISTLNRQLSSYKGERTTLRKDLQDTEVTIARIQQRIADVSGQLTDQVNTLRNLQHKRSRLLASKASQQQQIERHIVAAYRMGKEKKIKVLLNQEEPQTLSRVMTYYDYFNRAHSERIKAYQHTIAELDAIEPEISARASALESSKQELETQRTALRDSKLERERALARLNSTIKSKDQRLRKLEQDRKDLEALLRAVEETLANLSIPNDYRPFKALKGKMPWPNNGVIKYSFGTRNTAGIRRQGVTISATEGEEVKAIHHGRVVFADWFRGKGLLIIIDHGDGFMSLYAHNQSLLRETGDWVRAGETIARIGDSGGQQHAGLYFEIRHQGIPQNPKKWCQNRG